MRLKTCFRERKKFSKPSSELPIQPCGLRDMSACVSRQGCVRIRTESPPSALKRCVRPYTHLRSRLDRWPVASSLEASKRHVSVDFILLDTHKTTFSP